MGLLFTGTKEASSFNKYKRISRSGGEAILKRMNYSDRNKLRSYFKVLGTRQESIVRVSQAIKKKYGFDMAKKFVKAAEQHLSGGLTEEQKRRNIRLLRREEARIYQQEKGGWRNKSFAGQMTGRQGIRRVKGSAKDLQGAAEQLGRTKTGFALDRKTASNNTAPLKPIRGVGSGPPGIPLSK